MCVWVSVCTNVGNAAVKRPYNQSLDRNDRWVAIWCSCKWYILSTCYGPEIVYLSPVLEFNSKQVGIIDIGYFSMHNPSFKEGGGHKESCYIARDVDRKIPPPPVIRALFISSHVLSVQGSDSQKIFYNLSLNYCNFFMSYFFNVFFSKIYCNFVLQET